MATAIRLRDDFTAEQLQRLARSSRDAKQVRRLLALRFSVRVDRHFSNLLVVKINDRFEVSGRLVDRKSLRKTTGKVLNLTWEGLGGLI